MEKFFTTEQVASMLQVHPFTILKFIKQGKLKGIKLGRVYRITENDVREFLAERTIQTKPAKPQTESNLPPVESKPYTIPKDKDDQGTYFVI